METEQNSPKDVKEKKDSKGAEDEERSLLFVDSPASIHDSRIMGLYGSIGEERSGDIVHSLLSFLEQQQYIEREADEDPPQKEPVEFIVSTDGGAASEMFAIYDVMRKVRETLPLATYGLGKVMSAGVLLLAAGTKGERKIGKYCRVMIHSVISGHVGELHNLRNELEEVKHTQKQYIGALATETNMTTSQIKSLLNKKVNVYFTAEEAVELGIADKVV
jgi:ATP-dependent Clp protease protease subunit|tara:strand:+ start:955 stop:1611 length:657 start_codon:yes stop_codon:yes gene_type:complete